MSLDQTNKTEPVKTKSKLPHTIGELYKFEQSNPGYDEELVRNDDYAAMREVVARYYRRLVFENKPLPDLIVIDGGAGQLKAALNAFAEQGIKPPMMIGLAKREETFVFSDGRPPLTLPRDNAGLRLLQRVRDEAHRVANGFNAAWRSRQIKSSILDDCPGIGPVRRQKLFEKFPSLERLKKASTEEIAKIVGPKQAQCVCDFLKSL